MVYDGYVKYEEAEVDRLVATWKQITAAAADRVEYSKQPASARAAQLDHQKKYTPPPPSPPPLKARTPQTLLNLEILPQ